ncbi:MAG: hypothetical protein HYR79_10410 [Nitrospirae bacterium]|nr:hypothetical protein [Nitrospirota bacterium]
MEGKVLCESCGMPIAGGKYCQYCVDEKGNLQTFEERFERMVQWVFGKEPSTPRAEVERRTRARMQTLPAWKEHPKLKAK